MFNVSGLQAGSSYVLTVNSRNSKGDSKPITLYAFTVKEAEKHTAGSTHRSPETRYVRAFSATIINSPFFSDGWNYVRSWIFDCSKPTIGCSSTTTHSSSFDVLKNDVQVSSVSNLANLVKAL